VTEAISVPAVDDAAAPLPAGWRRYGLGELCADWRGIESGPSWSRLKEVSADVDGVPVITPANITAQGTVSHVQVRRLPYDEHDKVRRFELAVGDIVCVRQGTLGRQAVVGPAESGWLFGAACMRIRLANDGPIESGYLVHYMSRDRIRAWLFAQASGQTVPTITASRLAGLPVIVPPLDVQRDLLSKLGALDAQLSRHAQAQALLTELRASLVEQAVMQPDRLRSP
jgi:Type I restriction modification DNA specificity domain